MRRHVTRLVKSLSAFGIVGGGGVFFRYLFHGLVKAKRWEAREIALRTISRPIWLRPGVSDWIVMERVFIDKEYDSLSVTHDVAMEKLQQSILSRGRQPLIIDCGANIGLSSVWLTERFPQALIVAVEPETENYKILEKNSRNFPKIIPVNAAVSDEISRVTLSNDTGAPWAWKTEKCSDGEVETVTVDSIIKQYQDLIPFIVKVDIEGFEVNLLKAHNGWVDDIPLIIFEMHDWMNPWGGSGQSFFSTLARRKRDYLISGENIFAYLHAAFLTKDPVSTNSHVSDETLAGMA